jgi:hypothetical protein
MKELKRRLYTKPVMLGMLFVVGLALVVGLFITSESRAAMTGIPAGDDLFETTGNGETFHNFNASPINAGFFGPNSEEFRGVVPLVGVPIPGRPDDIDTIIHRDGCFSTPCTMGIQMTNLNLKSIAPITVTYSDSTPDQSWEVFVGLSIHNTSTGTMTFSPAGTSFDSTLKVWPRFTFKRNGTTLTWDTGGPAGPGLTASATIGSVIEPAPAPTIAPCHVIQDFEGHTELTGGSASAVAASGCAPVTLTSTNSPWPITRPITEAELLASHNASPPGTKKKVIKFDGAVLH